MMRCGDVATMPWRLALCFTPLHVLVNCCGNVVGLTAALKRHCVSMTSQ
ncbi:hypothetical protein HUZ99_10825 [Staphylococcus sp. SS87]|nr:hypothetical protein [Staphylococcus singaporensis]MBE5676915.1 hypothetical protein [Staphylococcus singaporensis]